MWWSCRFCIDVHPGAAQRQPSRANTLWRAASFPSMAPQQERTWSPHGAQQRPEELDDVGGTDEARTATLLRGTRLGRRVFRECRLRTEFPAVPTHRLCRARPRRTDFPVVPRLRHGLSRALLSCFRLAPRLGRKATAVPEGLWVGLREGERPKTPSAPRPGRGISGPCGGGSSSARDRTCGEPLRVTRCPRCGRWRASAR